MGMTIWVNTLKDGTVASDEADKSAMYRHIEKLDAICAKLGVRPLSDFLDTTDLEAAMGDESAGEDNSWEVMARDGRWFDPPEGLQTLERLIAQLRNEPVRFGLLSDSYEDVLRDLDGCRASVEKARAEGGRFHLCVVM